MTKQGKSQEPGANISKHPSGFKGRKAESRSSSALCGSHVLCAIVGAIETPNSLAPHSTLRIEDSTMLDIPNHPAAPKQVSKETSRDAPRGSAFTRFVLSHGASTLLAAEETSFFDMSLLFSYLRPLRVQIDAYERILSSCRSANTPVCTRARFRSTFSPARRGVEGDTGTVRSLGRRVMISSAPSNIGAHGCQNIIIERRPAPLRPSKHCLLGCIAHGPPVHACTRASGELPWQLPLRRKVACKPVYIRGSDGNWNAKQYRFARIVLSSDCSHRFGANNRQLLADRQTCRCL